ncbi:serine hydrolase [Sphingomonas alpina]|uniref:D-alanyl-D-alanine dipeptidase n=1 Tax=Sphingomonas alpina TaxID=653931 RepID=A0A7H0LLT4_9SPHN|nr:serine hydrolase [Sphingomonas alpina]QNQ10637.1 serine hydrolase [Sphingomonas alpina]
MIRRFPILLAVMVAGANPATAQSNPALPSAAPSSADVIAAVARNIDVAASAERTDKAIPSITVALVDRRGVIWSAAWGTVDAADSRPATPATLYRAGSVSKLFTDVTVMKLVEQGKLDLDAPVTRYLPEFSPHNPFGVAITLRQLMTHRSGLVREPPRGNYFDATPKGQADTVASLNTTTLVAKPGAMTKYSNAGIAVVGEVVARVTGMRFEEAVRNLVLAPLGMTASSFVHADLKTPIAYAQMASFDGGRWAAPAIDLGTPAAGNLYTNVGDLGLFVTAMLNSGALPGGKGTLLQSSSLAEMWRAQYPAVPDARSFGLGFVLGELDGQRTIGHGGAVYGHATDVRLMPDAGIGVIVFSTVDAGPTAQRIGSFALRSLLAAREGKPLPQWVKTQRISDTAAASKSGRFVNGGDSVNVRVFDGGLVLDGPEVAAEVRQAGNRYYLDDAQYFSDTLAFAPDASWVELAGLRYARADWPRPAKPDAELASLIGEYGWDYNVLRIYQRDGKPYARIEWTDWAPLRRLEADRYAFPERVGLYPLESLRFERDASGKVTAALLGTIRFPRRDFGAEAEAAVRSVMNTGIDALRSSARAARPPVETSSAKASDLIALTQVEPGLRLDIRYAATNNFMGQKIYERAGAFMQRPAAEAIGRIHKSLTSQGFGLLIHDAYRPWYVTKMFWDATPPANRVFVADPSQGSRHNRGAAVDLTMVDLRTGAPIVTTGRYDEFSSRSYSNYVGGSDEQRWLREVLRTAMERDGFTVYSQEWWHFDRVGWRDYPIGNRSFQDLAAVPDKAK